MGLQIDPHGAGGGGHVTSARMQAPHAKWPLLQLCRMITPNNIGAERLEDLASEPMLN